MFMFWQIDSFDLLWNFCEWGVYLNAWNTFVAFLKSTNVQEIYENLFIIAK